MTSRTILLNVKKSNVEGLWRCSHRDAEWKLLGRMKRLGREGGRQESGMACGISLPLVQCIYFSALQLATRSPPL